MISSTAGTTGKSEGVPETATRRPNQIVALTSLRGYLALWIVLYHFWNDILKLFPSMDVLSPLARVGHMAVPAFFMLSGFVLAYNYSDRFHRLSGSEIFRFQIARLARIYPVHLVTLLVVAAMVWVSGLARYQVTDAGYSTRDFVLNLLLMQTWVPDFKLNWNYPSWSISSEWFAYQLFPFVILGTARSLNTLLRAIIFSVFSLIASIAVMTCWAPRPFYELVLVIPTFFAGIGIYWILEKLPRRSDSTWWRFFPEVLVLVAVASTFALTNNIVIVSLLCCFLGLIAVLAWLGEKCHLCWTIWPAVFLGEVSYSLYMTHTLCQKMVYKLLPSSRFENAGIGLRVGVLVTYFVLILIWCLGSYYLVEKPSRSFFRRSLRRSEAPRQPL